MFSMKLFELPQFLKSEYTEKVQKVLDIIQIQGEEIQRLKEEIARLKCLKGRPRFFSNKKQRNEESPGENKQKRPGSAKRNKTQELEIHQTLRIHPDSIPPGAVFKGYKEYVVQDLVIKVENTKYELARYELPDGSYIEGELPSSVDGHFGSKLKAFILYQHHQCHVTQPLIYEELIEFGVDISKGQVSAILTDSKIIEELQKEKESLLNVALESPCIQVDDTGARHDGKNGFCTVVCNDVLTFFETTNSKSRINFLKILNKDSNKEKEDKFIINQVCLDYCREQKLPLSTIDSLKFNVFEKKRVFSQEEDFKKHLERLEIENKRHIKILTEGALLAALFEKETFNFEISIMSDDAGQFNILSHCLCWIHMERNIYKIVPFNDNQSLILDQIRSEIWTFYKELKKFKQNPTKQDSEKLRSKFRELFSQKTGFITLDNQLKRTLNNEKELLLVLEKPELPLHNNLSESDIREYVKRRKISGGTRSESGKKSRDTYTSLKKTARKLKVSFWEFLLDRLEETKKIPPLGELARQQLKKKVIPLQAQQVQAVI